MVNTSSENSSVIIIDIHHPHWCWCHTSGVKRIFRINRPLAMCDTRPIRHRWSVNYRFFQKTGEISGHRLFRHVLLMAIAQSKPYSSFAPCDTCHSLLADETQHFFFTSKMNNLLLASEYFAIRKISHFRHFWQMNCFRKQYLFSVRCVGFW